MGPFASLNGSLSGADDPAAVAENRRRIAATVGRWTGAGRADAGARPRRRRRWMRRGQPGAGPRGDAMVTRRPRLGLGIVTADCAPVLFADAPASSGPRMPAGAGPWPGCWRTLVDRWPWAGGACMRRSAPASARPPTRSRPTCATPCWRATPPILGSSPMGAARPLAVRPARLLRAPPARGRRQRHRAGADTLGDADALLQPSSPHACRGRPNRPSDLGHRMPYLPLAVILFLVLLVLLRLRAHPSSRRPVWSLGGIAAAGWLRRFAAAAVPRASRRHRACAWRSRRRPTGHPAADRLPADRRGGACTGPTRWPTRWWRRSCRPAPLTRATNGDWRLVLTAEMQNGAVVPTYTVVDPGPCRRAPATGASRSRRGLGRRAARHAEGGRGCPCRRWSPCSRNIEARRGR